MIGDILDLNNLASDKAKAEVELAYDALLSQSRLDDGLLASNILTLGEKFNIALDNLSRSHAEAHYQMVTENRQQPDFSKFNNPNITSVVIYQTEERCH